MAHVEMVNGKRVQVLDDNECRSCGREMTADKESICEGCGGHRCSECIGYTMGADLCVDCAADYAHPLGEW